MPTRREFNRTLALIAGATLLPVRAARALLQDGALEVTKLRDRVWLITGGGGNSLLLESDEGPVLVDAKVAATAAELAEKASGTAGGTAPRLVINTHHHADHVGGNFVFAKEARIVAHRNLKPRLPELVERRIKPSLVQQVEALRAGEGGAASAEAARLERRLHALTVKDFAATWEMDDHLEITFGGLRMRLRHFGPGHTDNDVVVFFPDLDLLHTGDLLFHRLHPFIDRAAKASTRGWTRTIHALTPLCTEKTLVIPGHGERTDVHGLAGQAVYFETLTKVVTEAIDAGRTREEIVALEPAALKDYGFERLRGRALGAVYDEIMEERSGAGTAEAPEASEASEGGS